MIVKRNRKRAVTPIVATILMFALTMAAIGISLVYMFPTLSVFKDQSYNNSTRLYYASLDATIRTMLDKQPPIGNEFLFYQEQGELYVDDSWRIFMLLNDVTGAQSNLVLEQNVTRLIHRSPSVEDYEEGEHRYMNGPEDQDYVCINGSDKLYNDISVINETRPLLDDSYLFLALYYRYYVYTQYSNTTTDEFYDIDIVHVTFVEVDTTTSYTQKSIQLQVDYVGATKTTLDPIPFINDVEGEVRVFDEYNFIHTEYPLYLPINDNFEYHYINVNIINLEISIEIINNT